MSQFIGNFNEFNRYIGGYCRNKVKDITKKHKNDLNKICQYCNQPNKELDAAHIKGEERVEKIKAILELSFKRDDDYYNVDLEQFENKYVKLHMPIEDHFFFLCKDCHRKYDNDIISTDEIRQKIENFPTITLSPVNQRFLNTKNPIVVKNNTKSYNLNKSDDSSVYFKNGVKENSNKYPNEIYKKELETLQEYVKRLLIYLYDNEMLTDKDFKFLQDLDYCKNYLGIDYKLLEQDYNKTKFSGHYRYWLKFKFLNKYYVCKEWWKQKFDMYEDKLNRWAEQVVDRYNLNK